MGIIVDLIIIAIVALSTFLAYKKGLIELAVSLFAFIITIVVTFILYQPITNLVINCTGIDEAIEDAIYERANSIMQENQKNDELTKLIETAKNDMLSETARNVAIKIVTGGVIIVLFVAIKIGLRFVSALANIVSKLPIINQLNQAGGIIYGLLRGILIVYVALFVISVVGKINPMNTMNQSVEQSVLGKVMCQNNILNVIF